tara:strand:+ start:459 stop:626 length:168 start_codon:yes stop_codon:yes gene_type:complete
VIGCHRPWPSDEVSLQFLASESAQSQCLVFCFDPFGNDGNLERMRKMDDGLDDCA